MDTLQATYKDEEEDEEEEEQPPLATTTTPISDHPTATSSVAADMELTNAPPLTTITPSHTPTEPQNDGKSEPDPSDDPSDEPSDGSREQKKSPKQSREEAVGGEDEPPSKKQRQLSPLKVVKEEPIILPEENNGIGIAEASISKKTPANGTAKKSKKKNNNVWATKSKKGKKKTKNNNNNNSNNNHHAKGGEDSVLVTPVQRFPDKTDDTPDMKICLSKVYKAEKVELSDDRLSAGSTKGYRMVRATRGVMEGAWYFEIKVVRLGETGHTRLGWTMEKGDLQAPVGYDGNSFGYRDIDGSKIHKALREKYGEEGYGEGDVIGFYINLPEGDKYAPKTQHLVWYKGQRYAYAQDAKDDPPKIVSGSEISFFKNGVCQRVAFKDLYGGRYYPAASMYTLPNEPNCTVKFNFGPDFDFFPEDFNERPIPKPMIEVPYHGFDNHVENGESNEKKSNGELNEKKANGDLNEKKLNGGSNEKKSNEESNEKKANGDLNEKKLNGGSNEKKSNEESNEKKSNEETNKKKSNEETDEKTSQEESNEKKSNEEINEKKSQEELNEKKSHEESNEKRSQEESNEKKLNE